MTIDAISEDSPLVSKLMQDQNLIDSLDVWMNSFYAVFFIEQIKMGQSSKYYEYLCSFPLNLTNFPELFNE